MHNSGLHMDVDVLIHARSYIHERTSKISGGVLCSSDCAFNNVALFCVHIDDVAYAFTYAHAGLKASTSVCSGLI
jgi:hypothetical protein